MCLVFRWANQENASLGKSDSYSRRSLLCFSEVAFLFILLTVQEDKGFLLLDTPCLLGIIMVLLFSLLLVLVSWNCTVLPISSISTIYQFKRVLKTLGLNILLNKQVIKENKDPFNIVLVMLLIYFCFILFI